MVSLKTIERSTAQDRSLGIIPQFEGVVIPRFKGPRNASLEEKVRDSILWDAAEAAFAEFNHWSEEERLGRLKTTIEYIREQGLNEDRIKLPVLERWIAGYSLLEVDETVMRLMDDIETGVERRHQGRSKFISTDAILDAKYEPYKTTGGIWRARVVRRGDERRERAREVRLTNIQLKNGRVNIAGMDIYDQCEFFRENIGRERRHGNNDELLKMGDYHSYSLLLHIKNLTREQKARLKLPGDYDVFMPYDFNGNENLVLEAIAMRYLPIRAKLKQEQNLIEISNFLLDHSEILSREVRQGLKDSKMFIGVGKYMFLDSPHRAMLDSIDQFLQEGLGYEFNGFAVDFRNFGPSFQTTSVVYIRPDSSRTLHVLYDSKFGVPPVFLFKMKSEIWHRESIEKGKSWNIHERPSDNPFSLLRTWYSDIDRNSQQWQVQMIARPNPTILDQFPALKGEYDSFAKEGRHKLGNGHKPLKTNYIS